MAGTATLGLLGLVGWLEEFSVLYFAGLALAAGIAAYHFTLIRRRVPADCFRAFNHNNWFGAAVCAGLALEYWVP